MDFREQRWVHKKHFAAVQFSVYCAFSCISWVALKSKMAANVSSQFVPLCALSLTFADPVKHVGDRTVILM